jgi:hypothetical protein
LKERSPIGFHFDHDFGWGFVTIFGQTAVVPAVEVKIGRDPFTPIADNHHQPGHALLGVGQVTHQIGHCPGWVNFHIVGENGGLPFLLIQTGQQIKQHLPLVAQPLLNLFLTSLTAHNYLLIIWRKLVLNAAEVGAKKAKTQRIKKQSFIFPFASWR